jgi:hypothetical protein
MGRLIPKPTGSRKAIAQRAIVEIFDHWNHVDEKTGKTRGDMTLTYLFQNEPANYARLIAALLPKEFTIENVSADMDEDRLDAMILQIEDRLYARSEAARPIRGIEPPTIETRVGQPEKGEG